MEFNISGYFAYFVIFCAIYGIIQIGLDLNHLFH